MSTAAHCLFCFETLASALEKRSSRTLAEVEKSWAAYVKSATEQEQLAPTGGAGATELLAKRSPALRRLAEVSSSSSSSATSSTASLPEQPQQSERLQGQPDTPMTSVSSLDVAAAPTASPLFVTWNTVSGRGSALRGCIGTFEAQELSDGLASYARISALQDTRFDPITLRELPSLEVVVTLLTDFEDAADAMDWDLGTHGLRISFQYHNARYGATYLPDVAPEQGWTKEQTVVSLMRKAGWMGRKENWRDVNLNVVRYQGKAEPMRYAEYKAWRDWADGLENKE